MTKFTIPGELCDLNTYINAERSNKYAAANIKKSETYRCQVEAVNQIKKTFVLPVHLKITYYTQNERKDPDNVVFAKKFILDGLVNARIILNDSRKFISGFEEILKVDKKNPRVVVEIREVR